MVGCSTLENIYFISNGLSKKEITLTSTGHIERLFFVYGMFNTTETLFTNTEGCRIINHSIVKEYYARCLKFIINRDISIFKDFQLGSRVDVSLLHTEVLSFVRQAKPFVDDPETVGFWALEHYK